MGKSISVELAAVVPNQTSPELITQNGAVRIEDINGKIQAIAYNGPVIGERLSGNINLTTHNGRIDCSGIMGDIEVRTHNGEVDVVYSRAAPGVINASVITHNGGIYFHAPPNLSASAELIAHNGIVKTKRPISIVGQISTKELKGTFGEGEGKLHLETQNGSIKIK